MSRSYYANGWSWRSLTTFFTGKLRKTCTGCTCCTSCTGWFIRNCTVRWNILAEKGYISWLKRGYYHLEWRKKYYILSQESAAVLKKPTSHQTSSLTWTITSTQSIETVSIDHGSGGYECLLVVTDYFIHYTQVYLTRNQALCPKTKRLFNDFILRFGIPQHVLHDQSKEFDNKHFHQLTKLCGVKQLRTTQYHPQTNWATECMNSLICSVLKILTDKEKTAWKDHINKLIFPYNCAKRSSTGYSPYH